MTTSIVIPLWVVLLATSAFVCVLVVAVLNGIAWIGAATELARLERKIMHISVFEREPDLRTIAGAKGS